MGSHYSQTLHCLIYLLNFANLSDTDGCLLTIAYRDCRAGLLRSPARNRLCAKRAASFGAGHLDERELLGASERLILHLVLNKS